MWLKTRKANALVEPLAAVVDGEVSDGRVKGSYRGYGVEARPHSGYPIKYLSTDGPPPESVNMLKVTLTGVGGSQTWHCQSSAGSYLHDVTSRFTAGPLLKAFKSGEFKFEGVDQLNESVERMGEKLVKRFGMPISANADPALQERLVAAGLFEELDALRLGAHPYLPKLLFIPGASELSEQVWMQTGLLARVQPRVEERMRAAGMSSDFQSVWDAKLREAQEKNPGHLELDVEAGKPQVPTAEQFRDVLEHAVRIAEINAEVNHA